MRVFLLGATPSFDQKKDATVEEKLAATGGNAGNQIIAHGLLKTFKHSSVAWDYSIGPDRVNSEFDVIVVAAANFLFPDFDLGGMADFIAATRLPIVMAGLGAQSNDFTNPCLRLKEGTRRLIKLVSERSALIGVRGEYSARVMKYLGFDNVQVTGCPSYYMSGTGFDIRNDPFDRSSPVAVHASRDVLSHSFNPEKMRVVVRKLYNEAARRDGIFVAQTEVDEITLSESVDAVERAGALRRLKTFFREPGNNPKLMRWLQSSMRVYWNVDEWIDAMKQFPLVLGTRFHCTMAALQAGTPAICICHDSRTAEMCEYLCIPHIGLDDAAPFDLESYRGGADFIRLRIRHAELAGDYRNFLVRNGLVPAI